MSVPVVFQLNFPYLAGGPDFRPLLGWFKDPGDLDTICGWVSGKRFKIPHIFVVTSRVRFTVNPAKASRSFNAANDFDTQQQDMLDLQG